jgi:hypothetical protein
LLAAAGRAPVALVEPAHEAQQLLMQVVTQSTEVHT